MSKRKGCCGTNHTFDQIFVEKKSTEVLSVHIFMRFIIQVWTHTPAFFPIAAPILMLRVRCVIFWVSCWCISTPPGPPLYSRNYTIDAEEPIFIMQSGRMLQHVAVCCSVLRYAAVCCSVLQCVAECCSVVRCNALHHGSANLDLAEGGV